MPAHLTNAVLVFDAAADSNARPLRTLSGPHTALRMPIDVAVDSHGTMYVANHRSDAITIYPPGAAGDARPIRTIAGPHTRLRAPRSVAVDTSGAVYVIDAAHRVLIYASGASGDVAPSRIIWGSRTELFNTSSVAVDAAGAVYALVYNTAVVVHAPGANGNATPLHRIGGSFGTTRAFTFFSRANDLMLGPGDTLFVTSSDSVAVFAPHSDGFAVAPVRQFGGPRARLESPRALGVDADGVFHALNWNGGRPSVTAYAPGASGDVAPMRSIAGNLTGLDVPTTVLEAAQRSKQADRDTASFVTVYAPDAAGDARPIRTIKGPHTRLGIAVGIAVNHAGEVHVLSCDGGVTVYAGSASGDARPIRALPGRGYRAHAALASFGLALGPGDSVFVASMTAWGGGRGYVHVYGPTLVPSSERPRVSARWTGGGFAVDSWGRAFVGAHVGPSSSTVHVHAPGAAETAPPVTSIVGPATELYGVAGLAVDGARGEVYATNWDDAVRIFGPPRTGAADSPPIRSLMGDRTGLHHPGPLALDARGRLYVVNQWAPHGGSIAVFASAARGNAAPVRTLMGPRTRLDAPQAIALDSRGNIYVANAPADHTVCTGYSA